MHILAEQVVSAFIPQSTKASRIAKRAAFFEVNSIDALAGRIEK
jgi:hypothetical protein